MRDESLQTRRVVFRKSKTFTRVFVCGGSSAFRFHSFVRFKTKQNQKDPNPTKRRRSNRSNSKKRPRLILRVRIRRSSRRPIRVARPSVPFIHRAPVALHRRPPSALHRRLRKDIPRAIPVRVFPEKRHVFFRPRHHPSVRKRRRSMRRPIRALLTRRAAALLILLLGRFRRRSRRRAREFTREIGKHYFVSFVFIPRASFRASRVVRRRSSYNADNRQPTRVVEEGGG